MKASNKDNKNTDDIDDNNDMNDEGENDDGFKSSKRNQSNGFVHAADDARPKYKVCCLEILIFQ